jgi:hypothetical protein
MKALSCIPLGLAVAVLTLTGAREAAAQCAVCPTTTSVVAFQPVVVPTAPAQISGWYPGKLLDTWAANRLAYRSAAVAAPVATAMPVTSYRPVIASPTSYMPIRAYRPVYYAPSLVATTAYSPVVTASAACCDACGVTVTGYATTTSACCGATVSDSGYFTEATPQPSLPADQSTTTQRPEQASSQNGAGGAESKEDSVLENGQTGGAQGGTDPASWEAPPLRDPRLDAIPDDPQNNVARNDYVEVTDAVYRDTVRPRLATTSDRTIAATKAPSKAIPSRAERDAMWTAVTD